MSESTDRKNGPNYMHLIFFLLGVIQTIAFAWIYKIDGRVEKVPVLEEKVSNLGLKIDAIGIDVKTLLERKAK